jgi:Xaa-Pro dipeptidase
VTLLSEPFRREYVRRPAPARLCNVDRLITVLADRGLDGIVALTATNQYYLASFGRHHSIPEENGLFPVIFSRHHPEHPVLVMPDFDLARLSFQPTWIEDVRPFRSVLPPGVQPSWDELSRFVPDRAFADAGTALGNGVYYPEMVTAIHAAMRDLGLDRGVVGFDNLAVGQAIASAFPNLTAARGDGPLRHTRASKTEVEVQLLRESTRINQTALERTVASWTPGMTYHDLTLSYQLQSMLLGGTPNLPDTFALTNPPVPDAAIHAELEVVDFELQPGRSVIFDCHGAYNGYCWDGGKSWIVGDEPSRVLNHAWQAVTDAMHEIHLAARPGITVNQLTEIGFRTFRQHGVDDDEVLIFFHGLGLDHLDQDMSITTRDWPIRDGMVISSHIYHPGNENGHLFLEEIAHVSRHGAERFFNWDTKLF